VLPAVAAWAGDAAMTGTAGAAMAPAPAMSARVASRRDTLPLFSMAFSSLKECNYGRSTRLQQRERESGISSSSRRSIDGCERASDFITKRL
jgi:hypothetical protein